MPELVRLHHAEIASLTATIHPEHGAVLHQVGRMLSKTRIPIAELSLLQDVAQVLPAYAGESDGAGNTTLGLSLAL